MRLVLRLEIMLISQFSLETHSINGGRGCKCRVEVGLWRVLITQLSLERRGWALLSSPLKLTKCREIVVATVIQRLKLGLRLSRMLITPLSLETQNIH
jgi:hypothetical protein